MSFDIVDELFIELSVALVAVGLFVPLFAPLFVVPVALVLDGVVPVAVPLERVVLLLFIEPLVVPVAPGLGAVLWALLVGEPEAPPWPPEVWASAPPHAIAAAAERARILKGLMGYS